MVISPPLCLAYWYRNKQTDSKSRSDCKCCLLVVLAREEFRVLKRSVGAHKSELGTPKDAVELEAPEHAVVAHRASASMLWQRSRSSETSLCLVHPLLGAEAPWKQLRHVAAAA